MCHPRRPVAAVVQPAPLMLRTRTYVPSPAGRWPRWSGPRTNVPSEPRPRPAWSERRTCEPSVGPQRRPGPATWSERPTILGIRGSRWRIGPRSGESCRFGRQQVRTLAAWSVPWTTSCASVPRPWRAIRCRGPRRPAPRTTSCASVLRTAVPGRLPLMSLSKLLTKGWPSSYCGLSNHWTKWRRGVATRLSAQPRRPSPRHGAPDEGDPSADARP
jgi:hypothetical protein